MKIAAGRKTCFSQASLGLHIVKIDAGTVYIGEAPTLARVDGFYESEFDGAGAQIEYEFLTALTTGQDLQRTQPEFGEGLQPYLDIAVAHGFAFSAVCGEYCSSAEKPDFDLLGFGPPAQELSVQKTHGPIDEKAVLMVGTFFSFWENGVAHTSESQPAAKEHNTETGAEYGFDPLRTRCHVEIALS
jgi:hypothetical protein